MRQPCRVLQSIGATGATGADSNVPGPASTVPGATGQSIVGATGQSIVGATGATVPGATGADSNVPGPGAQPCRVPRDNLLLVLRVNLLLVPREPRVLIPMFRDLRPLFRVPRDNLS